MKRDLAQVEINKPSILVLNISAYQSGSWFRLIAMDYGNVIAFNCKDDDPYDYAIFDYLNIDGRLIRNATGIIHQKVDL